jgi:hypothetical protein
MSLWRQLARRRSDGATPEARGAESATLDTAADPPAAAPQRTTGRWSFGRALALLVVANIALGSVLLLLRSPGRTAEALAAPPALPAPAAELQAAIAESRHGEPYVLALSDAELTATASYFLAQAPEIPFGQVKVAVTDAAVVADGVTKGLVVPVPVRVVASVEARDGLPRLDLKDVGLGKMALPAAVRDQVIRAANASLDLSRYDMPMTVDVVEPRPGGITVRGTIK